MTKITNKQKLAIAIIALKRIANVGADHWGKIIIQDYNRDSVDIAKKALKDLGIEDEHSSV